jgi:hypothetical protein
MIQQIISRNKTRGTLLRLDIAAEKNASFIFLAEFANSNDDFPEIEILRKYLREGHSEDPNYVSTKALVSLDYFVKHQKIVIDNNSQFKTLESAKELIGKEVKVLSNNETPSFIGIVSNASQSDIDGILISVIDHKGKIWDIEANYISVTNGKESWNNY